MVNNLVIPAGSLSLDEHINRINDCRDRVKTATFEFVDAIKSAHDELGNDVFQLDVSQRLGISPSTLSRWLKIGNSQIIKSNINSVPPVFSSLYEITLLESKYVQKFGEKDGLKKLQSLFNRKSISTKSEQTDIKSLLEDIQTEILLEKKLSKQSRVIELNNAEGYVSNVEAKNLKELIQNGNLFRTFLIIPPNELLTKWGDDGVFADDIHNQFPIAELRGMSSLEVINCLICVRSKQIDTAIKILYSCGFNYRDIFIPNENLLINGYKKIKDELIIVHGQRGMGSSSNINSTSSGSLDSILELAEEIGSGPYLLVFNKANKANWTSLENPL